jgi:hypothetical protein
MILTGESGRGKSTLSAMLGERGWRFMGDEFALLEPRHRPASPVPAAGEPQERGDRGDGGGSRAERFGPAMEGTPKGRIQHSAADRAAMNGWARRRGRR